MPLGYGTVIRIAGLAVALIAATDLIVELRRGTSDNATDIVGGIGYYAGAVLMAVGAFQIREPSALGRWRPATGRPDPASR